MLEGIIGLIVTTLLYAMILLLVLWFSDVEKMEPISKLLTAFVLGFASLLIAASIESTFTLWGIAATSVFMVVMVAPIAEELAKIEMVREFEKEMDEPEDALIYGGSVALGFAFLENVLYIVTYSMELEYFTLIDLAMERMVFCIPAHITATVTGAAVYYYFRKTSSPPLESYIISIIPAAIIHSFYNMVALTGNLLVLSIIVAVYVALTFMVWWLLRSMSATFQLTTKF